MEKVPNSEDLPRTSAAERVLFFVRLTVGMIFLLSGAGKLFDITSFTITVSSFHILPAKLIIPFSTVIPFAEVLFGIAFILGGFIKASGVGLSVLLVSFLIAIGIKLNEGTPADCGCGGVIVSDQVSLFLFFKDVLVLIAVIIVFVFSFRQRKDVPIFSLRMNIFEAITMYVVCAIAAYSFFIIDEVIKLY